MYKLQNRVFTVYCFYFQPESDGKYTAQKTIQKQLGLKSFLPSDSMAFVYHFAPRTRFGQAARSCASRIHLFRLFTQNGTLRAPPPPTADSMLLFEENTRLIKSSKCYNFSQFKNATAGGTANSNRFLGRATQRIIL